MKAKKSTKPHPEPVDALVLPRFSGVPTFMRLPHIPRAEELDIAILGIPFDGGTTYRPGARFGPRHIRVQSAMIRPWNPVLEVNPFRKWRIADLGDLSINPLSIEDTYGRITAQLSEVLKAKAHPVSVGGDHSILLPILRAVHRHYGPVGFVQLDAHGDTWGGYFGSPHSHGTPVKYAVEEGLIAKGCGLQVGLRGQVYSDKDFEFARKHRIQMVTAEQFHEHGVDLVRRLAKKLRNVPVYLTLDIDVVDPAFAPGTGTPQVGGLSSAQILDLVRTFTGLNLVGCDLVEVSPPYDNGEITSLLAANLLFELLCLF
ncbi:MAG TPA: agmatinase [Terriglobales bacterium]|nr:agmatinase [Terriglobales bacterium]